MIFTEVQSLRLPNYLEISIAIAISIVITIVMLGFGPTQLVE